MVGTMVLAGGEQAASRSWVRRLAAHVVGGAAGGAALGLTSFAIGWALFGTVHERVWGEAAMLAVVVALLLLAEVGVVELPALGSRRQVRRGWDRDRASIRAPLAFGFVLGLGVTTRTRGWLMWALIAVMVFSFGAAPAAVAGAVYGGTRAALVVARVAHHRSAERYTSTLHPGSLVTRRRGRLVHTVGVVNGVVLAATAAVAVASALHAA